MVTIPNPHPSHWLTPAAIARAVSGRVVRTGSTAERVVTNSREVRTGDVFLALRGPRFDAHDFVPHALEAGAAGVIVERVPESVRFAPAGRPTGSGFVVRVPNTGTALLELAGAHRDRHSARVVGITGSCGKTSTKDMLGFVLSRALETTASPKSFNNHVGVPLSLLDIRASTRAAVIEIGTSGPGEIERLARIVQPDVAILTCVREAHLSGLKDLDGVSQEKAGIFAGMRRGGLAILNGDDRACERIAARLDGRIQSVRVRSSRNETSAGNPAADWFATDVGFCGLGTSFRLNGRCPGGERSVTLPRLGSHNVYNALFCIAVASEFGVDLDTVIDALAVLPQSERRLEPREVAGVRIVDDSYNMNPASARAAIHAIRCIDRVARRIVVFGEMRELGPRSAELHHELGADVAAADIDLLVTVGEAAAQIGLGAGAAGLDPARVLHVADISAALAHLLAELRDGDVVLFKASRAAGLDRLVDELVRELSGAKASGSSN